MNDKNSCLPAPTPIPTPTHIAEQRMLPRKNRHRCGAAVVAMVVVLGGLAIALLILAGKTSIQLKSVQNSAMETQQCNELIDLGEFILAKRLAMNPEFNGETLRLEIPSSLVAKSIASPQLGTIELAILEKSESDTKQPWSIAAYLGTNEQSQTQSSKTIYFDSVKTP